MCIVEWALIVFEACAFCVGICMEWNGVEWVGRLIGESMMGRIGYDTKVRLKKVRTSLFLHNICLSFVIS